MKDFFEAIAHLFVDFSWKRLLALLLVIGLIGLAALGYERYTSSFRLERIRRTAEVLTALKALDSSSYRTSRDLGATYAILAAELRASAQAQRMMPDVPYLRRQLESPEAWWRFLAGSVLWLILACFALNDVLKEHREASAALAVTLVLALISGAVSAIVPVDAWWAKYLVVPLSLFVVTIVAIEASTETTDSVRDSKGPSTPATGQPAGDH
jgi:hypothetical protein